jgi:predicted amidohydrolase
MHLACVQSDIVWEDKPSNHAQVRRLLEAAGVPPGGLVILPEMFATGFSMNTGATVELEHGETLAFLAGLARDCRSTVLAGLAAPGRLQPARNQAVALNPDGQVIARYTKIHPFSLGGETKVHEPGDEVVCFPWDGLMVAPFVCYDLRFPEVFRIASARGAELMVVIANWPEQRIEHWVTLLQARAIENLAYVVGVNRTGRDPFHDYPGRSLAVDPHGKVIADAGSSECVLRVDIDPGIAREWRAQFPALKDRQPRWSRSS